MKIASTGIDAKGNILVDYTADGENINPPITFSEIPDSAKSLALLVDDADAPDGPFTHWLLFDMPPSTLQILEGQTPAGAKTATNSFGQPGYGGPQPPSGTHHYHFQLFALDTVLDLPDGASHKDVGDAIMDHVIDSAEIVGLYSAK